MEQLAEHSDRIVKALALLVPAYALIVSSADLWGYWTPFGVNFASFMSAKDIIQYSIPMLVVGLAQLAAFYVLMFSDTTPRERSSSRWRWIPWAIIAVVVALFVLSWEPAPWLYILITVSGITAATANGLGLTIKLKSMGIRSLFAAPLAIAVVITVMAWVFGAGWSMQTRVRPDRFRSVVVEGTRIGTYLGKLGTHIFVIDGDGNTTVLDAAALPRFSLERPTKLQKEAPIAPTMEPVTSPAVTAQPTIESGAGATEPASAPPPDPP